MTLMFSLPKVAEETVEILFYPFLLTIYQVLSFNLIYYQPKIVFQKDFFTTYDIFIVFIDYITIIFKFDVTKTKFRKKRI